MNKLTAPFYKLRYFKNWHLLRQKVFKTLPKRYCGHQIGPAVQNKSHQDLLDALMGNKPLFCGRLGHTENYTMIDHEFIEAGFQKDFSPLVYHDAKICSGMYPLSKEGLSVCAKYQKDALRNMTHFRFWHLKMEPYWIRHYCSKCVVLIENLDPFSIMGALKGKRVLVVSAFPKTIESQYARRHLLFKDESFLPAFHLIVEKAPVTFADVEPILPTWKESLMECYARCVARQFDVALIGAGSYSNPLGNLLFQAGAQVVVMNSSIQIVFGIKGKRWETQPWAEGVRRLFNEHWVYPMEEETPEGHAKVDPGSGYWR